MRAQASAASHPACPAPITNTSNDVVFIIEKNYIEYPKLKSSEEKIKSELKKEYEKFNNTLTKGLRKFYNIAKKQERINGEDAFLLYQSFGFPIEMTKEIASENNITVDINGFYEEFEKHQKVSRAGANRRFGSGLADKSRKTIRLHTATHLLNEALRNVLGGDIIQKGSNITPERLRFDFNFHRKLNKNELKEVEDEVNKQITKAIPIKKIEMTFEEAKNMGAQAVFEQKYGDKVSVYVIGDYSIEVCGGPHVKNTSELGHFRIIKESSISAGVRRIRAILE